MSNLRPDQKIQASWIIIITFLLMSFGMLTTDMYIPSLPAIGEALQTSSHAVRLTIT